MEILKKKPSFKNLSRFVIFTITCLIIFNFFYIYNQDDERLYIIDQNYIDYYSTPINSLVEYRRHVSHMSPSKNVPLRKHLIEGKNSFFEFATQIAQYGLDFYSLIINSIPNSDVSIHLNYTHSKNLPINIQNISKNYNKLSILHIKLKKEISNITITLEIYSKFDLHLPSTHRIIILSKNIKTKYYVNLD
ncbi:hypothetical protein A3Q56_02962 [Intoshia linei]|uniref:Uncharacterized protein n=1 Tax=Intoshia linei TaxID=1819745 RepID=A0A177B582_9BILA|nr:hypothetical protein A3Q56_02962 [Intoshia linei]